MTPNNDLKLNSVNSDSTDSDDTKPTMPAPKTLQALPAELIGILSEHLDNSDLLAMRTTCRELRDGSALELYHRLLESEEMSGTHNRVRELADILTSPNFTHAKKTFTKLCVTMGVLGSYEAYEQPSPAVVMRPLRAMPGLETANFMDDLGVSKRTTSAVFFACMAQMPSQVRRVGLLEVQVKGDLLADMLEAHSNDLRTVILMTVTLDSLPGWLRVMRALHSTQITHLELMGLTYADDEAGMTLLSMGSYADFRRSGGGEAHVGDKYVDVSGGNVKPALEFIIQHIEKCVKARAGLGQNEI